MIATVGEWESVNDCLPEMGEYVLVYPGKCIGVRTETFDFDKDDVSGWHWERDGEGFELKRVTHWARIRGPHD